MPFPLTPVRFWTHEPVADASMANVSTAPSNGSSTAHALTSDIGQLCETKPPNRVVLFLHIYKTGGTSNRLLFQHWAEECGMSYGLRARLRNIFVQYCHALNNKLHHLENGSLTGHVDVRNRQAEIGSYGA